MPSAHSQARAELRREEQRRKVTAHKRRLKERRRDRDALWGHAQRRVFGV